MSSGVYIRTEKHRKAMCGRSPSQKQLKAGLKNLKIARTLRRTQKQLESSRKMGLSNHAATIIKHHNDLCHGAKNPNDVSFMSHSEHSRLHANLRVKNGTHNFQN